MGRADTSACQSALSLVLLVAPFRCRLVTAGSFKLNIRCDIKYHIIVPVGKKTLVYGY